jgi:hypothetical protein
MAVPGKFTPVQRNVVPQGPPPPNKGTIPAFPIFASIVYAIYIGVMIIGPMFITQLADELDPLIAPFWRLVGAGILFVVLALIIGYTLVAKPKTEQQGSSPITKPGGPAPVIRIQPPSGGATPSKFKPAAQDRRLSSIPWK